MDPGPITFHPILRQDLLLLHEWLNRPHVAEWWDQEVSLADVQEEYGPCIDGTDSTRIYFALQNGEPDGFIQSYIPVDCHAAGWWLDEGDPNEKLFADDPTVTRIQTDPSPGNPRAIRCYEKAGFRRIRELDTPDGPALLMYCDRPQSL